MSKITRKGCFLISKQSRRLTKILAILLAMVIVLSEAVGIIPVNATGTTGNDKILMGVPTVDGVLDDIYKQSLTLTTGTGSNAYGTAWGNDHGNIYFLYSENYLYICAEIVDNSVVSAGEIYVSGSNPCNNDCCEFRLSLNGGVDTIKVGIDAYGLRAYGLTADEQKVDYSKIIYATTYNDSVESSGYVIEAAIPCTEGILDLHAAGKLGFKLQLNDLDYDGTIKQFATEYDGEGAKGLVYYELSDEIVSGSVAGGDADLGGDGSAEDSTEVDYRVLSFEVGNYVLGTTGSRFGKTIYQ